MSLYALDWDARGRTERVDVVDPATSAVLDTRTVTGFSGGEHWIWERDDTRCTATFSADGTTQTAHHERLTDDGRWVPSMEVVLTKV